MIPFRAIHRLVFLLLATCMVLGLLGMPQQRPVRAQQSSEINMQVKAGFVNLFKEDQWIPLRIILENNGPDYLGSINARFIPESPQHSSFSYLVELPSISRKEITLYIYPALTYTTELRVGLFKAGAKDPILEQTITLTRLSNFDLLTGVLAANAGAYNIFSLLDPPNGAARVESLSLSDLPESVYGFGALDILVISAVDTGLLNDQQLSALDDWISWGGQLFLTGGPDWQETIFGLKTLDILPFIPDNSISVQGSELDGLLGEIVKYSGSSLPLVEETGSLVLTTGTPALKAEVLLSHPGDSEIPLILKKDHGKGQVIYLAFDPSIPPFRGWTGVENLYRTLTGSARIKPQWGDGFQDWQMAAQAAQTMPSLGLPSVFLICGFLAIYIAAIGPANFFFLRYLKRRELGWVTIPVLVIFFSVLVFVTGSISRGQSPVSHRLSVVQVWEDSTRARVDGVMGIYSPNRATYNVATSGKTVLHNMPDSIFGPANEAEIIQNGDSFGMSDLRIDVGGVYPVAYQSSTTAPLFKNELQLTVQSTGTVLKGTITNLSSVDLENAVLLTPGGTVQVGNLNAGGSFDVDQLLDTSQTSSVTTIPNVFRSAPGMVVPPIGVVQGGTVEQILGTYDYYQDRELYRKFALLTAALGYSPGNLQRGNEVYLLGWSDQTVVDIDIVDKKETFDDLTLYIASMHPEINFEGDTWTLSPGFFQWASIDPQRTDISPYDVYLYTPTSYGLVFSPGYALEFSEVVSLTFHLLNPYQNGAVSSAIFSLWDFEIQDWQVLDNLVWGDNQIEAPSRFVADKSGTDELGAYLPGTIRLNVQTTSGYMEINTSDFTLVVSR